MTLTIKIASIVKGMLEDIDDIGNQCKEAILNGQTEYSIAMLKRKVKRKVKSLKVFREDDYQYAGMVRFLIDKYRERRNNDPIFLRATQILI